MIKHVHLKGPAFLYAKTVPAHLTVVGTVTDESGGTGALVRDSGGRFAQLNGLVLRPLDKREVIRAIAGACIERVGQRRH